MRDTYTRRLERLHTELIRMGSCCEDAIASAVKGLLEDDTALLERAIELEKDIDRMEREIETLCINLILREQPVAGDLRRITAAQKMVLDMERIGDQAADIAELATFMPGSAVKSDVNIANMAAEAVAMLTESVDSFVAEDLEKARHAIRRDDAVDDLFCEVRNELIELIKRDGSKGAACLDLLMIAKYLERIGDHAENIADSVVYAVTGE